MQPSKATKTSDELPDAAVALQAVTAQASDTPADDSAGVLGALQARIDALEQQARRTRYVIIVGVLVIVGVLGLSIFPESVIVKQTLMESEEVKLVDNAGNTRLFLRMYSRVPVLQLLDTNGKPRMSLGLRFDDTPFIDLSDRTGRTRATFEMTQDDEPTLKLFNKEGDVSFAIN